MLNVGYQTGYKLKQFRPVLMFLCFVYAVMPVSLLTTDCVMVLMLTEKLRTWFSIYKDSSVKLTNFLALNINL